jgi:hypothetical protein
MFLEEKPCNHGIFKNALIHNSLGKVNLSLCFLIKGHLCGLVVRVPGCRSRGPHSIFLKVVGLEQGPLSLLTTIVELLDRKSSGSSLESREYGRRDPSH